MTGQFLFGLFIYELSKINKFIYLKYYHYFLIKDNR